MVVGVGIGSVMDTLCSWFNHCGHSHGQEVRGEGTLFIKLGVEAFDYDILNDYGETDYVIDLFAEIRGGVRG